MTILADKVKTEFEALASSAKSWPFEEAKRILNRIQHKTPPKGYVLFQTGYGPSGLPHIGTFGEVVRTTMVRQAFELLSDIPTRLFCFSDDMDGLRKVPDNIPNAHVLAENLNKPLSRVPDPFGQYESFAHYNNTMLKNFLDSFGFEYEFQSSTDWYTSGRFDEFLKLIMVHYDDIMGVILPTLREERRQSYSPFLPVCERTGQVLQVNIISRDIEAATITYMDEMTGKIVETSITGGRCKLQWKADWGMRWRAFDVDYEMSGKDLIDSVKLSSQICRIIGGRSPENFTYELFLDEKGQKISKSKGNGLTMEDWLKYAPAVSLSYYMFQSPRKAKRLYFDVIPRHMDEYVTFLSKYESQSPEQQLDNPVWHIHCGTPPQAETGLSFGILLNLASVCNAQDASILWGFVTRYQQNASPETTPFLNELIHHAIAYYHDYVMPFKQYRAPHDVERPLLTQLKDKLTQKLSEQKSSGLRTTPEEIQTIVYEVGKGSSQAPTPYKDLKDWFSCLYEVLLGQSEGPRMGSFIELYGLQETIDLIDQKLSA